MILLILGSLLFLSPTRGMRMRYDGYQVWEVNPADQAQKALLAEWNEEGLIDMTGNEVMVAETSIPRTISRLVQNRIHHNIKTVDIQHEVEALWTRVDKRQHDYDKDDFNKYEDIIAELRRLERENCPVTFDCTTYSIGQSYEGRDLVMFKISKGEGRQALWFDSLIHAREWVAGSTLMRVLDQFLMTYETDEDARYVLDKYDIYFLPVQNPDGYAYTWSTDRFWRKNRYPNNGSECIGVDLNRNFDWHWGDPGASNRTCSNAYHGPSTTSENEAQAVQAEVLSHMGELKIFTTIHTAIPAWLTSYGDCTLPENHNDIMRVANAAVDAIVKTHNADWLVGNSCRVIYGTSGNSADWAASVGIPYTWTPELRGPGFDPGQEVIPLISEEMWNGFIAMVREVDAITIEARSP